MNAEISFKLFEITKEFVRDNVKAKEFVSKIEQAIDNKFDESAKILATKQDLSEAKVDIIKWQIGTAIAVIGIIIAIVKLI
ncbi:MAG: hypothetical protein LBE36_04175 [Flavobacteriaceae bacterium]|jgi:CHASE3 domain sensor protein|nr:hypothetical protein [Flavobacteriaceae bacterium]